MRSVIQSIFLNDLMILLMMGMAGLALTSWAFRYRQYAGYLLGWLVGLFFIVTFSSMVAPAAITGSDDPDYARLSIFTVMFAAIFGFITSLVMMVMVRFFVTYTRTTTQTWLTAIGISLIIGSGYLMLITSDTFRLVIAIFVLAMAIAMLLVLVLYPRQPYAPVEADILANAEMLPGPTPIDQVSRLQDRFKQQAQRDPYL